MRSDIFVVEVLSRAAGGAHVAAAARAPRPLAHDVSLRHCALKTAPSSSGDLTVSLRSLAFARTLELLVSRGHVVLGEVIVVAADEAAAVAIRVETGDVVADDGPTAPFMRLQLALIQG